MTSRPTERRRTVAAAAAAAEQATTSFNEAVPMHEPTKAIPLPLAFCDDCPGVMARTSNGYFCRSCGLQETFIGTIVLVDGYPEAPVYRRNRPFQYAPKQGGCLA